MNKKDILKVLDISSLVTLLVATGLAVLFEFTGKSLIMKYSIIFWTAGFLIAIVFYSLKLGFSAQKKADGEPGPFELEKSEKVGLIVKIVLVSLAFVFSCIVLIMY